MRTITTNQTQSRAEFALQTNLSETYLVYTIIGLQHAITLSHNISCASGWWRDPSRNVGEAIALMHSELSEALEGARKDLPSDHIEGFTMLEEELADTLVRIFDFAGGARLRLAEAFVAKSKFNRSREDHKAASRDADGGKKF